MDQHHPRFRRLSESELQSLEHEFVDFLASQSITAVEWQSFKQNAPDKVEALIGVFSDIVLQKVLEKISLLEKRSAKELFFVECGEDQMSMIGMVLEGDGIDLTQNVSQETFERLLSANAVQLQLVSAEKAYRSSREEEVFEMLQSNYLISKNDILHTRLKTLHSEGTASK